MNNQNDTVSSSENSFDSSDWECARIALSHPKITPTENKHTRNYSNDSQQRRHYVSDNLMKD